MSARTLLPLLLACCALAGAHAQSFAPAGARWVYPLYLPNNPNPGYGGARVFTAAGDTLLGGRTARILADTFYYADGERQPGGREAVYVSGDSVYLWHADTYRPIFAFDAAVADTFRVITTPFAPLFESFNAVYQLRDFQYRVDSLGTRTVNGEALRLQYVRQLRPFAEGEPQWGFRESADVGADTVGQILEGVGHLGRQTPLGASSDVAYLIGGGADRLACYDDATRSYRFGTVDCDSLLNALTATTAVTAPPPPAPAVYPNPFRDQLRIDAAAGYRVAVRDAAGRPVALRSVAGNLLDFTGLPAGVYYLLLDGPAGRRYRIRTVKQ